MSWIYADFLKVRPDLVDVYTEEVDKTSPNLWQAFIPHQDMHRLLSRLLDSLERKSKDQTRSLWLHGAYGTGKTFAAFVIKHLLEDPIEIVEAYLNKHDLTRHLSSRFRALRERGPYLVVWRSSSGHLDSQLKFFAELQQAVGEQLQRQGYKSVFPDTFKDEVLQRLQGTEATYNWPAIFEKYRWQVFPEFSEAAIVLEAARTEAKPDVLARISMVLEKEGVVLTLTPESMKMWLKEIIEKNRLQGICCLWDEFSDFFVQNHALGGLQELAHAAVEFPFYLLLVTHRSPERMSGDQEAMRKILERFHNIHFQLQPVTTYSLAGNAIEVRLERHEEWEDKKLTLWDQVKGMAGHLFDQEGTLQEFQKLVPLQPYSAFLLSTLARQFTSSQRTLFRFLKSDQPAGFGWFLQKYPIDETWYWVTPDILWDYFFGEEAGETELTERVRDVVSFYQSKLPLIQDPLQQRFFKGVMLFLVLYREMTEERLRPCRRNLSQAFQGTPLPEELSKVEEALRDQYCLNLLPMGQDEVEYTLPLTIRDPRRFQGLKDEVKRQTRFDQLATEAIGWALKNIFMEEGLKGLAARRTVLLTTSGEELQRRREHIKPNLKPYQIGVVLVTCLMEQQLREAERVAEQCASRADRVAYLVLLTPFSERRWERWLDELAHERYCQVIGDEANKKFYERRKEDLIKEWLEQIKISSHSWFWRKEKLTLQGLSGFKRQVEDYINSVYPARPEKISTLDTLFKNELGVAPIKIGLGINPNITRQFRDLEANLKKFSERPDNPVLNQLQDKIREFFRDQPERYLADLWEELQQPPFGLFLSPIAGVLMGFFLKDLCTGHYYCDGVSCRELNPDKMAELINQVMGERRGHRDISIRKSSPLADQFCRHLKKVFSLADTEGNFPEDLKQILRQKVQRWGYPLWTLNYLQHENYIFGLKKLFIHNIQGFLRDFDEASRGIILNEEELIEKAKQAIEKYKQGILVTLSFAEILAIINLIAEKYPALLEALPQILNLDMFSKGFQLFIQANHPELAQELVSQQLPASWVVERVRELMQEEVWLWDEEVVGKKLPIVHANLLLLGGLNQLCGLNEQDLKRAIEKCTEWLQSRSKLPWRFFGMAQEDEEDVVLFNTLDELMQRRDLPDETKDRVGRTLRERFLHVREAVNKQAQVLTAWLEKQIGQTPTLKEAQSLLTGLPNLALETDDQKIQQEILQGWEKLKHRRLINDIKGQWQKITGSASPQEWSRSQRIPINWVLTEDPWPQFCNDFARLTSLSDELLGNYCKIIQEHAEELRTRLAQAQGQILLQMLLQDYEPSFQDGQSLGQLQEYLVNQVGEDVEHWPARFKNLQEVARQWLSKWYKEILWPEVESRLASLSVAQAKTLLQELVQDPGIGIRFLIKVRQSHEQPLS